MQTMTIATTYCKPGAAFDVIDSPMGIRISFDASGAAVFLDAVADVEELRDALNRYLDAATTTAKAEPCPRDARRAMSDHEAPASELPQAAAPGGAHDSPGEWTERGSAWIYDHRYRELKVCAHCGHAALEGEAGCSECRLFPDDDSTWREVRQVWADHFRAAVRPQRDTAAIEDEALGRLDMWLAESLAARPPYLIDSEGEMGLDGYGEEIVREIRGKITALSSPSGIAGERPEACAREIERSGIIATGGGPELRRVLSGFFAAAAPPALRDTLEEEK